MIVEKNSKDMCEIIKVSKDNYAQYVNIIRANKWGNMLMPDELNPDLWGGLVRDDSQIMGGWIGVYRGNKPIVKWLTKSVYFDSYPIFISEEAQEKYQLFLIETMREWAKKEHIVMFNLTHWVRGRNLPYLQVQRIATFLIPLQNTSEEQLNLIESKQRRIIRKAEQKGVEVHVLKCEDAIAELPTLQALREQTQQHAIRNNAKASMLMKSNQYYINLFRHTDSTLFIGYADGKPATVLVSIATGETAYNYSGGSDYELNRLTGCSAYVKWKGIEYYREQKKVKYLDMGGVPPTPQPGDPAYGVYYFKRSFGGEYMEFDAGVIIINKLKYAILKFALSQQRLLRLFSKKL